MQYRMAYQKRSVIRTKIDLFWLRRLLSQPFHFMQKHYYWGKFNRAANAYFLSACAIVGGQDTGIKKAPAGAFVCLWRR
ncbi:hypothetical protein SM39_3028 [Serratia marcescens SM39]|uniref:Uncharacterized protein n=1 Tax=Serratia marcescens SM39 TaxID=1334564 RepID=A0AAT9E907_SERMA|nr:hypothetical protein SM39_3028 [Serratia marcescens SM39]